MSLVPVSDMLKLGFAVAVLVYNKFIIVPTSHGVRDEHYSQRFKIFYLCYVRYYGKISKSLK